MTSVKRCERAGGGYLSNWPKTTRSREWSPLSQCSPWPRKVTSKIPNPLNSSKKSWCAFVGIRKKSCITKYWNTIQSEMVNNNLYCQQLERVNQELVKNGVDSTKTRLLHDNARCLNHDSTNNRGARLDRTRLDTRHTALT